MTVLARLALVLALALGGTGTTAFAAQASLPSDLLYPVKIFSEDFRLALTTDSQAEFNLLLELAQKRASEIAEMANAGDPVSSSVNLRLQEHLEQAVQQAAQLDDEAWELVFARNLLLMHYYGLCTPSLLQASVAHHTPMLVNPVPAVVDYLGEDYPLYYSFYQEAAEKAADLDLVVSAHQYLARLSREEQSGPERLWHSLWESLEPERLAP